MVDMNVSKFLASHFIQLKSALDLASAKLPRAGSHSSGKACLAEAILNLASEGETEPAILSEGALAQVASTCPRCRACDGLCIARQGHASQRRAA
jgi:hypothetical protein